MTDPNKVRIVCLVDRTGSMADIKRDMEGAFGTFMDEQRAVTAEAGDRVEVDLFQFDHTPDHPVLEPVYRRKPLADVPPLVIQPRGGTPLNDAMALTIVQIGAELAALPEPLRPRKVYLVVITDGEENRSVEYRGPTGAARVKAMVVEQERRWNWEFHFLGVGIDAFTAAASYGIGGQHTNSTHRTGPSILGGYAGMSASVGQSRIADAVRPTDPPVVEEDEA